MNDKTTVVFKLSSNEEIMGIVKSTDKNHVKVINPMTLYKIQSADGTLFYALRPWFAKQYDSPADIVVGVAVNHIIAQWIPNQSITAQYEKTVDYFKEQENQDEDLYDDSDDLYDLSSMGAPSGRLN